MMKMMMIALVSLLESIPDNKWNLHEKGGCRLLLLNLKDALSEPNQLGQLISVLKKAVRAIYERARGKRSTCRRIFQMLCTAFVFHIITLPWYSLAWYASASNDVEIGCADIPGD
jgi:hypothetical protein